MRSGVFAAASVLSILAAPVSAAERVSPQALEFPEETAALIAVTAAFFDAAERAAMGQNAPSQPVIGLPEVISPASLESVEPAYQALTNHGAVQHLTGYDINWYPVARLLGTVDFMGTWDNNRNLVCGYVSWDLSTPEAPVLENVSANYVDLSDLQSASPERIHQTLLDANCAHGAIDVNFALFDTTH